MGFFKTLGRLGKNVAKVTVSPVIDTLNIVTDDNTDFMPRTTKNVKRISDNLKQLVDDDD